MKTLATALILSVGAITTSFAATLPCDTLKAQVAAKFDAKGVKNYNLEIVASNAKTATGNKVVGSCEGGSKQLVYSKK